MSINGERASKAVARREASFVRRSEPVREFSNGKLAILAAVLIAAVSGAIMLLILR